MSGPVRSISIVSIGMIILSAPSQVARASDNGVAVTATAAAADSACALLTKEDAAAALGEAVKGPESKSMADAAGPGATVSYCEYTGSGYHRIHLDLTLLPQSSVPMYRAMCKEKATKDLAGLGDVACWYNEKHGELHALKGTAFLSIEITRSGDPTEAIKGAMKKSLDRLR